MEVLFKMQSALQTQCNMSVNVIGNAADLIFAKKKTQKTSQDKKNSVQKTNKNCDYINDTMNIIHFQVHWGRNQTKADKL